MMKHLIAVLYVSALAGFLLGAVESFSFDSMDGGVGGSFNSDGVNGGANVETESGGSDESDDLKKLRMKVEYGYSVYLISSIISERLLSDSLSPVYDGIGRCVAAMDREDLEKLGYPPVMADFVERQIGYNQHYRESNPPLGATPSHPEARNYAELFKSLVSNIFLAVVQQEPIPFPFYQPEYEEAQRRVVAKIIGKVCLDGLTEEQTRMLGKEDIEKIFSLLVDTPYTKGMLFMSVNPSASEDNGETYWENMAKNIIQKFQENVKTDAGLYCMPRKEDLEVVVNKIRVAAGEIFETKDDGFLCMNTSFDYNPEDAHAGEWEESPKEVREKKLQNSASAFKP